MSKQTDLNVFLKDTADAIRTKKGTTELINPQNFRAEIESIGSNTGSGDGGESNKYLYYDISGVDTMGKKELLSYVALLMRQQSHSQPYIVPPINEIWQGYDLNSAANANAIMVDPNLEIHFGLERMTCGEYIENEGFELTEITKEQFYTVW